MSYLGLDPQTQLLNTSTEFFSGNAAATQFTLSRAVASAADLDVIVGNVAQVPFVDYSAGNLTLLFTSPPDSGTNNIAVTFRGGALNTLDLTATVFQAGTVGAPSVVSLAANNTGIYWASANTVAITVQGGNRATFNGEANSISNVTGALTVTGGIGATGNINTSGTLVTTDNTESDSISTGALRVGGGAGIIGNLNVGGDITCVGDFTVNGTFTTTGTDSLEVNDPLIFLANANPGDTFDIGIIGQYNDGIDRYTGFFRDITDDKYKLFGNLTVRPTTVIDTGDASFVFNDLVLANLSATGNIEATYFLGNGSLLTGLSGQPTEVLNGNSKVAVPAINGNVNVLINAVQIANFWSGGISVVGSILSSSGIGAAGNITGGNLLTGGLLSATGNITSAANLAGGNLAVTGITTVVGNIIGGNVRTNGAVSAAGNVTSGNINSLGALSSIGDTFTANVQAGGSVLASGVMSTTGNITGANIDTAGLVTAAGNITGGNLNTGGGVYVTGVISADGNVGVGNLNTAGQVSAAGNITGNYFIGNGSQLTGIDATSIQNGNSNVRTYANGNVAVSVAGTANVAIFEDTGVTVTGFVSATGNITGGNVITGGAVSATGVVSAAANVIGSNINTTGVVSADGNVVGGNVNTVGLVTATGNITGGNIITGGSVSATGAVSATANVIGGNIATGGAISATGLMSAGGNITGANLVTGGLISAAGNVTSAANIAGGNVLVTSQVSAADVTASANISATGNVSAATFLGTSLSLSGNVLSELATTSNITGSNLNATGVVSAVGNAVAGNVITAGLVQAATLSATGNVIAGNLTTAGAVTGNGRALTSLNAGNLDTGTVPTAQLSGTYTIDISGSASTAATVTTAAQPNVTSLGTLTALTVTGNTTSGNVLTGGLISATGDVAAGTFTGNGRALFSLDAGNLDSGTVPSARLSGSYTINISGSATTAATVTTAAQPNITSLGTLSALTVTGNITGGNLITAGLVSLASITKTGSNGVGNIGSISNQFDTVHAKATSAQYADLAEMYVSDRDYPPGTVVAFGGEYEVTVSQTRQDTRVAGVVSTNPSYLMNATQAGEHVVAVALTGRVPTSVVGTIRKGDLMVSAGNGVAMSQTNPQIGTVIGKALQDHDGVPGMIEIVVGRQ